GRMLRRPFYQVMIEKAQRQSHSRAAERDRCRRRYLMEGSFADATNNHGLKRSRWRRVWRQHIQDLLIASCQNLPNLLSATPSDPEAWQKTINAALVVWLFLTRKTSRAQQKMRTNLKIHPHSQI